MTVSNKITYNFIYLLRKYFSICHLCRHKYDISEDFNQYLRMLMKLIKLKLTVTHCRPYLALQVVYLVGVLPLVVLATQEGMIIERFVLEHLDPLPSSCLILARLRYGVQLSNLWNRFKGNVLQNRCLGQYNIVS